MGGGRIYYGWFVLAAGALSEMLAIGSTSYSAGLFVLPLQGEFHLSRTLASSSIIILFLGGCIVSPLVGRALDTWPIRLVMSLGAVILAATFAGIAATHSLIVMALLLFIPGAVGFMCLGPLTTSTLASRWFYRRRGLALGIAAIATSGGGLLVVPLLSAAIKAYGWRLALTYEAAVIAVVVTSLAVLVLRDSPIAMALGEHLENVARPSQEKNPAEAGNAAPPKWRIFLNSRDFWTPTLVMALISGICQALVITFVPYGLQLGFQPAPTALVISAFSVAAAMTKVIAGMLADRVDQRRLLSMSALFLLMALLLLGFSKAYIALLGGAALAGVALGFVLPTAPAMIAAAFGTPSFGTIMGVTYVFLGIFAIGGVIFVGQVYDRLGGYHPAFVALLIPAAAVLALTVIFAPTARGKVGLP
jgi:sugar phosphate permease